MIRHVVLRVLCFVFLSGWFVKSACGSLGSSLACSIGDVLYTLSRKLLAARARGH
jgi:hypothetical protein